MPLIAREYTRVPLEKPPLQLVVAQVQFPPILGLVEPRLLSQFQEAIRDDYPRLSRVETVEVSVGPGGLEARPSPSLSWAFEDSSQTWRVVIDANSLSLETRKYDEYPELRRRLLVLVGTLVDVANPTERTRLGLRYVNHIRIDDATGIDALRPLFRSELFGLAAPPDIAPEDAIKHSLGETRFADDEGQLVARYGYVVGGQDLEGKPSRLPTFLLDIDHFDVRIRTSLSMDEIGTQLDDFHEGIYRVFRWALTSDGEALLGLSTRVAE
jgi:uncharacterized protein (TIGR04255 family)